MPDYNKFKKIMQMMAEYESEFEEAKKPKSSNMEDEDDGGQAPLADMSPELDCEDDMPSEKKRSKVAMYGTMLKKKMGY